LQFHCWVVLALESSEIDWVGRTWWWVVVSHGCSDDYDGIGVFFI
jgi:hypothetical protein